MFWQKKNREKLTIQEYLKIREAENKRKFRLTFYPWPVSLALLIPLGILLMLLFVYYLHIRGVAG